MNTPPLDSHISHMRPHTPPKSKEITLSEQDAEFALSKEIGKRIVKKEKTFLARTRERRNGGGGHVLALHNIVAINQGALGTPNFEQSYFKTLFYLHTVDRVQLRKQALIVHLRPSHSDPPPSLSPQQIIQRLKLSGEGSSQQLASSLITMLSKLKPASFVSDLMRSFDGEPLSRFIESMEGEIYFCKAEPNKLVISRALLELLGEDPDNYALEMVKYRMPLKEFISARSYPAVLNKLVENLGLMCDFIKGEITTSELHASTSLDFNDYLLTRQHTKIHCKMLLYMPTPQMTCFQVREVLAQDEERTLACPQTLREDQNRYCQQIRYNEAQTLNSIMRVPKGLLRAGIPRQAGYKSLL